MPDRDRRIEVNRHEFDRRATVPFTTEHYRWYRSIERYLVDGVAWNETVAHEHYSTRYSEDRAEEKRVHLDGLYRSIETEGYRTPAELASSEPDYPRGMRHPNHNVVVVDIGRDGSFIFEDGKHRACVAKAMGVETVPVRVLVRHEEWQAIREEVFVAGSVTDLSERAKGYLEHPDIRPLARDLQ